MLRSRHVASTAAANVRVVPGRLRAAHNRLHDRRDLEFVLHELEGVKRELDELIAQSTKQGD